jgi:hypothetical protein
MKIVKWISLIVSSLGFTHMTNKYNPKHEIGWFICIILSVLGIITYTILREEELK